MIDQNMPCIKTSQIKKLLPHREPMLLIDNLYNIDPMKSAIGHLKITTDKFYVQGHFPGQPVMPGVMIVEAFGQSAAALAAYSLDPKVVEDKLVYLMSVQNARFRKPVMPPCDLYLKCKVDKIKGKIWRYKGEAYCNNEKMADAEWMATIVDRND
ncbi:MAG: 3-hydroxyacyl-ACP dehydratase FabZ [Pelagibacteraceae bacterium]|jgi:3-hydroxyacyl-[acyl-carrier-protein] dehydratase|nr:3-hydroxyacyl-ACP dehydratase FabZ [Pelagibacteraceae bacterium]MCI5079144.1 3-hydroxyacyl-ACP dehydratase FabZ [Pelagibacteraceae bacterium]